MVQTEPSPRSLFTWVHQPRLLDILMGEIGFGRVGTRKISTRGWPTTLVMKKYEIYCVNLMIDAI
jgi:hypothetical protein